MADHDDDFDTWQPDGTQALGSDSDSAWATPSDAPSRDEPPAVGPAPARPGPVGPPPVVPPPAVEPDEPATAPPVPPVPPAAATRSVPPPAAATRSVPPPDAATRSVLPPDAPPFPPPFPPSAPPPQRTRRRRRSHRMLALVVVIVGFAIWGVVASSIKHPGARHFSGPSLPKNCGTPTYHVSSAVTSPPQVKPHPEGTSVQTSQEHRLAFAVPSGWKAESAGTLDGYENRCGEAQIVLGSVAKYGSDYCPASTTSYRAIAGTRGAKNEHNVAAVAREQALAWATWSYSGKNDEQPNVVVSRARPFTMRGLRGSLVRATARATVPLACGSARGVVYAIAVDSTDGADVFVVSADQGESADLSEADLLAIAGSLHRVS